MTLYLYGGPKTRVSMPKWYLAEKGISYEYVNIDLAARQNLAECYLEVNPFGKLPALKAVSYTHLTLPTKRIV